MQARTQIDQPVGLVHKGGQHVGREHVDGPELRQAIGGFDAARLAVADPDIVDHRIEASPPVGLLGDDAHGRERRKIADQHRFGLRQGDPRGLGPGFVPGMQHDTMPLFGQETTRHQAEPIRRTRDEDACHSGSPFLRPRGASRATSGLRVALPRGTRRHRLPFQSRKGETS